jgi:hypothetical protein
VERNHDDPAKPCRVAFCVKPFFHQTIVKMQRSCYRFGILRPLKNGFARHKEFFSLEIGINMFEISKII